MAIAQHYELRSRIQSADCGIVARAAHDLAAAEARLHPDDLGRARSCLAETHGLRSAELARDYLRVLDRRAGVLEAGRLLRLSPDPEVRSEAYWALVDRGPEALPVLRELSAHPDPSVRRRAYGAIRLVGGDEALALLAEGLDDPDVGVRWVASNGLIAAREAALVHVLQALVHRSATRTLHHAALRVLRRCRPPGFEDEVQFLRASLERRTSVYESAVLAFELLESLRASWEHRPAGAPR